MPLSERQLAAFADKHARQIPFDTSPRHLAGPGDARHVTHGLAAVGWTSTSDPLSAEIVLRSPDRRYRLQFDPQSATSAWWRLRAEPTDSETGWYAEFGELVPAEILSHVTDALLAQQSHEQPNPCDVLTSAGWQPNAPDAAQSPDAMCHIERRHIDDRDTASWHIEAREPGYGHPAGPRIWHAWFDAHTPSRLVTAFATGLADPAPLQRGMYERTAHYNAVQEPSPLRPQQVADAHTARIDALRARARAARRQQTKPTTAPAPASSLQPAARR
ncbi:DUF317 domain-containing protein [Streptomyces sp. NPDC002742]|uniref:DUF317 domain-containing protein n=1 Tax=Streptomyces sp. NPDC002742 TaxID=3364663 RepID=UPI003694C88D